MLLTDRLPILLAARHHDGCGCCSGSQVMMRFLALLLFSALLLPLSTQGMAQGNLDGVYDVQGVNPNGSTYSGEVTIQRQGSSYQFRWRIGSQTFQGSGALRGGSLTVNWGQRYPVIYVVGNDGVLRG